MAAPVTSPGLVVAMPDDRRRGGGIHRSHNNNGETDDAARGNFFFNLVFNTLRNIFGGIGYLFECILGTRLFYGTFLRSRCTCLESVPIWKPSWTWPERMDSL